MPNQSIPTQPRTIYVAGHRGMVGAAIVRQLQRDGEINILTRKITRALARIKPEVSFAELVSEMMREDLREAERDQLCRREGFATLSHNE